jgi:hypothetical protein
VQEAAHPEHVVFFMNGAVKPGILLPEAVNAFLAPFIYQDARAAGVVVP